MQNDLCYLNMYTSEVNIIMHIRHFIKDSELLLTNFSFLMLYFKALKKVILEELPHPWPGRDTWHH